MQILITGNLGYIGSRLVSRLAASGHELTGLDASWFAGANVEPIARPQVQHTADIRDLVSDVDGIRRLRTMLDRVDAVVHLAAVSNDPMADLLPSVTYEINYEASVRFARAARDAGVRRFFFFSTCSVYGDATGVVDESTPPRVLTPYADTKLRLERELQRLASSNFLPIILRSATVYGYAPALRLDLIVNGMAAWALTTGVVRLISTGEAFRPQVHVDDLVELTTRLLDRDEAGLAAIAGHPLNVGANEANYTIRALAELVATRVSGASVRLDDGAWVDRRSYRVRFDRLEQLVPEVAIRRVEETIDPLVAQYRRVALADGDVRELRFTRLKQLRQLRLDGVLDDNLRARLSAHRQIAAR